MSPKFVRQAGADTASINVSADECLAGVGHPKSFSLACAARTFRIALAARKKM
jgi:hypothetical protein